MRLGILGGTFDPIHIGHLWAAEEVRVKLRMDRLLFVPAGDPPHRSQPCTPAHHRLAMIKRALAGNPFFKVTDLEIKRPGKSFTVETLARLSQQHPGDQLFFILGADQLLTLPAWHEPERIFNYARFIAIPRPGIKPRQLTKKLSTKPFIKYHPFISRLAIKVLDISSTDIRQRIKTGRPVQYLLPDRVLRYIGQHHLYS